jgi:hypothetical protein
MSKTFDIIEKKSTLNLLRCKCSFLETLGAPIVILLWDDYDTPMIY